MCRDCGCGKGGGWHQHEDGTWHTHDHEHTHEHTHEQAHDHHHHHHHHHEHSHQGSVDQKPSDKGGRQNLVIDATQAVLAKNDQIAQENRLWFMNNRVLCLNWISSPGTGKTLLLEKLLGLLSEKFKVAVLVGDQATSLDADRLQNRTGTKSGAREAVKQNASEVKVKQINTHSSCHLDAPHIQSELGSFITPDIEILIIENVGNLVCPSAFDLGEACKVALISTTEGEDKPLKYPVLFAQAQAVIFTKMDLEPHLPNWSFAKAKTHVRRLNSMAPLFATSAQTGQGLEELVQWMENLRTQLFKDVPCA